MSGPCECECEWLDACECRQVRTTGLFLSQLLPSHLTLAELARPAAGDVLLVTESLSRRSVHCLSLHMTHPKPPRRSGGSSNLWSVVPIHGSMVQPAHFQSANHDLQTLDPPQAASTPCLPTDDLSSSWICVRALSVLDPPLQGRLHPRSIPSGPWIHPTNSPAHSWISLVVTFDPGSAPGSASASRVFLEHNERQNRFRASLKCRPSE